MPHVVTDTAAAIANTLPNPILHVLDSIRVACNRVRVSRNLPSVAGKYFSGVPVRGRTSEAVTDALREAILDGALAPATWLREDEIADTFAVSRTPVRDALRRLADEGLAVKTAHQGTVVAPLSIEDILALYVVREDLEGVAARLAAGRCPPELLENLKSTHVKMQRTVKRNDPQRLAQLNLEFHRTLRLAAGNPYLDRFLLQVEQAVRRLPSTTFAEPGRTTDALAEHQAIIDAVGAGDAPGAEAAAKEHMRRAREIRVSVLLRA